MSVPETVLLALVVKVKWVKDNLDGYLNFYSIAGDGRVTNWTLVKSRLWHTDEVLTANVSYIFNLIGFEKIILNFYKLIHKLRIKHLHYS